MKIKKTIKVTATAKEIETIGSCIALLEEMEDDVWEELNSGFDYSLGFALSALQGLYDRIEEEDDD